MIIASTDVETTGFLEPDHRIVEVYVDLITSGDQKVIYTYEQRINPLRSMPAEAQRVHHISGAELIGKPSFEVVGPMIHKILGKADIFVAHNAQFDFGFYNQEFVRIGLTPLTTPVFCTMEEGIWASPTGKKPALRELCYAMDIEYDPSLAHAASYDVKRMNECFFRGVQWGWFTLPDLMKLAA